MKKSEGGQGGGLGHSNMAHWETTAEVKANSKRIRRTNDKLAIREQI